ncbi:hypothetical protein, partial [Bacteroides sp. HPS0048]|uniref:hypothetical protein n=1 Tax=Bacteroides sp. HPS0048 TaxID=1078089 RepID=UPI001E5200FA
CKIHSYSLLSIFKFDTKVKEIRGWDKSHTVSAYRHSCNKQRVLLFYACFNVIEFMLIIWSDEIQLTCIYVINVSQ